MRRGGWKHPLINVFFQCLLSEPWDELVSEITGTEEETWYIKKVDHQWPGALNFHTQRCKKTIEVVVEELPSQGLGSPAQFVLPTSKFNFILFLYNSDYADPSLTKCS